MKHKRKRPTNHKWTEEERAIVRRDYRGNNGSQKIADALGVTKYAVKGQAQKLGIMRQKSPKWKNKEIKNLEELIHHKSVGQIAKILGRSQNAVKVKATRLELKMRVREGWYTKADVCAIVGEDHKKVQQWIDRGFLKAAWHYDREPCKRGMSSWHIEERDLKEFLINYSAELIGRNVDIQQIVWIVTGVEQLPWKGGQVPTAYPADFIARNEVIKQSWRDDECPDAKKLRDRRARELRRQGWKIECFTYDYTDLGRFTLYGLEGYRPRTHKG